MLLQFLDIFWASKVNKKSKFEDQCDGQMLLSLLYHFWMVRHKVLYFGSFSSSDAQVIYKTECQ